MSDLVTPPTRRDIEAAAARLSGHIRVTPTVEIDGVDLGIDVDRVVLKLEQLQHSGTFKARGALHALLTASAAPDGVVAASGGNHGVAVAWAAERLGVAAHIFVPEVSAANKVARLVGYGATVHQVGAEYSEALAASEVFVADHDVTTVHAYDQFEVMAGAGTLAREIDQQCPDTDTVVVACGGGGLAGGLASWWGPSRRLVVCETEQTASYASALAAGAPVDVPISGIGADALGARRLGALGWRALSEVEAESALVSDADVEAAQAVLWAQCRLRVEPAGAAALAALRHPSVAVEGRERVVIIVCGANVA